MSCLRRGSGALCLLLVVAGCGGEEVAARKPAAKPGPCARAVVAVVSRTAGARPHTRVTAVSPGQATCVYATPGVRVDVMIDNNPQAAFRFDRAVVERGQNAVWGHNRSKAPQQVHGVGVGADWFPADRQFLTTARNVLVTVSVIRPKHGGKRLSKAVAKATLASDVAPGPGRTLR